MTEDRSSCARRKLPGGSNRIRAVTEADRNVVHRLCAAAHAASYLRAMLVFPD
ncbi:hypothetical protein [Pseudodonghicola xiamenensis]|uniref:hypothetical protein n=1 Tax=Pseudodonghicola xiamenensis TaxID=337702 RepID=UPI000419F8D4|nr:hypothetical protein [Pseudodonghicola xiamenensis]